MVSTIIMRKACWVAVAVVGCLLPGCVTASEYYDLEDELARSQEELAYMRDTLERAELMLTDVELDQEDLARLQAELAAAQQQRQDLMAEYESFRGEMGIFSDVGLEGIVDASEGMYGYRAEGDVLFVSGSSQLTAAGKKALEMVVQRLKSIDSPIRIDGHTDVDPIVKTKAEYPHGNIQLGAARAIAVREFLVENGVDGSRISIASFGEFKPVVGGKDSKAKAKNRRVEIMIRMANSTITSG
ncbi:MAG: OmpA family protein [Planctomycetota bacterium]|nr:OmpA family protein [Planctomycetota bacterium]